LGIFGPWVDAKGGGVRPSAALGRAGTAAKPSKFFDFSLFFSLQRRSEPF